MELTLEQKFELRRLTDATSSLSYEEVTRLLLESYRLLYIKTNVLTKLMQSQRGCWLSDCLNTSLEQDLRLGILKNQFAEKTKKELTDDLLNTIQQIMSKDNIIKQLFKADF